jgi:monoterpene epsilon-lactone hydrolase
VLKKSFGAVVVANAFMLLARFSAYAQDLPPASKPSILFEKDGTAHIVDLNVPIPRTISPQAESMIRARHAAPDLTRGLTASIETLRRLTGVRNEARTERLLKRYPVSIEKKEIGGVVVRLITPEKVAPEHRNQLLINLHAGAFIVGAGLVTEAIPIAYKTGIPVLAIDYRLAPEHPFPDAVDDVISVYTELLKTYTPTNLSLYGSSAGAVLSAQALVRAQQLNLPLPASLGFFSGTADFARPGDTEAIFGVLGFSANVTPAASQAAGYLTDHNLKDPVMSPIYANLREFPPTLCMSGTRDFFLSGTANFHRALLRAGVKADLVVFDAMPHIHWAEPDLPESDEALELQAQFLARHTGAVTAPIETLQRRTLARDEERRGEERTK